MSAGRAVHGALPPFATPPALQAVQMITVFATPVIYVYLAVLPILDTSFKFVNNTGFSAK